MKSGLPIFYRHVLPAAACFGLALVLSRTALVRRIEDVTRDERTKLRLEGTVASDDIALIGIDETSLREIGRWPFNREVHGELLQLASRVRPGVIAWDIMFLEASPADDYFAKAISLNRSVVLGATSTDDPDEGTTPAAAIAAGNAPEALTQVEGDPARIPGGPAMLLPVGSLGKVAPVGFVDAPPDPDGVLRHVPLLVRIGNAVYPSLSLRTLMEYWGATARDVTVRLGDAVVINAPLARRRIPIDATGAYTVNYRHDRQGFVEYGYSSTLVELADRLVEKKPTAIPALTGRILLVGQVADGLSDFGPTPFSPHTPLVLVHANVIENILRQDYVKPVSPLLVWGAVLLVGIVGTARFSDRRPVEQAAFAIGVPVCYLLAAVFAWINGSFLLPVVAPLLGFILLQMVVIGRRMLEERRAKEQIRGMFGTYVSPELVSRLVEAGEPPRLGGHVAEITAYFSDIQEFSTFSEVLPPESLVELMNEYLTACTDLVQGEGGTLDKYIGDAVVAMFGAPVALSDHAVRACMTVVRVQEAIENLRQKWRRDGKWPDVVCALRSRIGLNTGPCVIGNMGSRTRFDYTMMGDNVNLAARMESGAKSWGTYAMCTDATRQACETHGGSRVVFRPLGRIQVKGRSAAVPIHEIAGMADSYPNFGHECIAVFTEGLQRFFQRDWDGALERFRRSATLELLQPGRAPGVKSNPSLVYIELTSQLQLHPPAVDWDGTIVMKEK
ncbi:MAG TPA: adenylate/guanylate cyclase domain-containing protein [Opitutaceae bacterium]|nr:adenylate/guanylate cyclase domain-containing protein [Opitutaceae bacterium]